MVHASTLTRRARLWLLVLVLISAWAVPPRAARAQRPVDLTVNVIVTDQSGQMIPSGTVTIKRRDRSGQAEKFVGGLASVSRKFVMMPDYQVIVAADNYKQPEPPPTIPVKLLEAAAKGDKIVTLPEPIVMLTHAKPEQPTETGQLQAQLSTLIPKHPELLDAALQQVGARTDLQERVRGQVANGQHPWIMAMAARPRSLLSYWWVLGLPAAFLAGLLAERVLRGPPGDSAGDVNPQRNPDAAGGRPARHTAPGHANQGAAESGADNHSLAAKVELLVRQQEIFVGLLDKLVERQAPGADGSAYNASAAEAAVVQDRADASRRAERSGEATADAPRRLGNVNEYAQSYYRSLMRDGQSSPPPKYLDAEVRSSPKDLVGDKQVFLQEVTHTQGAFVLFADEHGKGWVFPNPQLNFSPALRPVFPLLTASDFNSSRETVEPVPAVQVGDDRWKVERRP